MTPIERVVKFWSDRFLIDDKREQFEKALKRKLTVQFVHLDVDYDPFGILLEVVREIGIECRGYMFSADGIFSGIKMSTSIPKGKNYDIIEAKDGYANWGEIDENGNFKKTTNNS